MSLDHLLAKSVVHESIPVEVDRRLTIGAWAGLGLLLVQMVILDIGRSATDGFPTWSMMQWAFTGFGHPQAMLTVTIVVVVAGLVGAALTRGFTRAASLGHAGQLALVGTGSLAAIPAAWIVAVGVLVIVVAIAATAAILWVIGMVLLDQ